MQRLTAHRLAMVSVASALLVACSPAAPPTSEPAAVSAPPSPTPVLTEVWEPGSLAIGADGTLYTTDCVLGHVFAIDPSGTISVFAGTGVSTFGGGVPDDGVAALETDLHCPAGIGFDADGNFVVVNHASNRIQSIAPDGIIHTIVGGGPPGTALNDGDLAGDGGLAVDATLQEPVGIAFDEDGNLYFADRDNHAVRRVGRDGVITTVAGTGVPGFSGDAGLATDAQLHRPQDLAVDHDGTLYLADAVNNRIRKVDPSGVITTIAGTGQAGYDGDGGPAIAARLSDPVEIVIGPDGAIYFSSDDDCAVRRIDAAGIITTVVGTGICGFSGDGGPAAIAQLHFPTGILFDAAGNLYIGDSGNNRIRMVSPEGVISTYSPLQP